MGKRVERTDNQRLSCVREFFTLPPKRATEFRGWEISIFRICTCGTSEKQQWRVAEGAPKKRCEADTGRLKCRDRERQQHFPGFCPGKIKTDTTVHENKTKHNAFNTRKGGAHEPAKGLKGVQCRRLSRELQKRSRFGKLQACFPFRSINNVGAQKKNV